LKFELKLGRRFVGKWEEVQEKTGGCCEQSERVGLLPNAKVIYIHTLNLIYQRDFHLLYLKNKREVRDDW